MQPTPKTPDLASYRNIFWLLYALEQKWSGAKVHKRIHCRSFWDTVDMFKSPSEFLNWEIIAEKLFPEVEASKISFLKRKSIAHFEYCSANNIRMITPGDAEYPTTTDCQTAGPLCFSIAGPTLKTEPLKLGIIGTRKPTIAGVKAAFYLGKKLTGDGAEVFSGGAYGCDIAALRGSLDCRITPNRSSIVFPSGLAVLRPKGLMRSFQHLKAAGGRWISPFFYDHEPRRYDYLYRNQFLARLIDRLYVIEAPAKSGSMSTATACAARNVPIKVWSPKGIIPSGNASLLQDYGAKGFRLNLNKTQPEN